jgi:AraC-like DNA-binding protein
MSPDDEPPSSSILTVVTSDVEEARELCGSIMYPRTMRIRRPGGAFTARFSFLRLGAVVLGDMQYGTEATGSTGELGSYHVNLPLSGSFVARHGGRTLHADAGRAAVYRPVGENVLERLGSDCRFLALKIDRDALEELVSDLLGAAVRGPLRLSGILDVTRPPGSSFARILKWMAGEADNRLSLVHQPIVAKPLLESLLLALLFSTDHQYSEALNEATSGCTGKAVKLVIDAIHADPGHPYTITELANLASVSARCLQAEFKRRTGVTPMQYLRRVRIARAHSALAETDGEATSVADIAQRWGFAAPGRHTARNRYGYHSFPPETIHPHGPFHPDHR